MLVVSSCSFGDLAGGDGDDTTTSVAPDSTVPQSEEELAPGAAEGEGVVGDEENGFTLPPPHPALSELAGQLAITDGADVVVSGPDGSERTIIDGSSVREVLASQPVWSPSGDLLAWSVFGADRQAVGFARSPDEAPIESDAPGSPVYYMQWQPDGEGLVFLRNGAVGGVEAGTVIPGEAVVPLSTGQPFFVSWGRNSERLAAHVGSNGGRDGTLSVFEVGSNEASTLVEATSAFTVPAWLDESSVVAVSGEGLVRIDAESQVVEVLVGLTPPVQFVVNSDGSRIAYRGIESANPQPGLPPLMVLDVSSGISTEVAVADVAAWEWSPDGTRLAILTTSSNFSSTSLFPNRAEVLPVQSDRSGRFQWAFWQATDQGGELIGSTPGHEPSRLEASSYLPFFEQYAQSHHRWSPDGTAFAFAGTLADVCHKSTTSQEAWTAILRQEFKQARSMA